MTEQPDGFGNNINGKFKIIYESPEDRDRRSVMMTYHEMIEFRDTLDNAKFSDFIELRGVGMVKKSAIVGIVRLGKNEQRPAKKTVNRIFNDRHDDDGSVTRVWEDVTTTSFGDGRVECEYKHIENEIIEPPKTPEQLEREKDFELAWLISRQKKNGMPDPRIKILKKNLTAA